VSPIPVEVVDRAVVQEASPAALYVELSGGLRIGVGAGFDAVTLRRLMVALGEVQQIGVDEKAFRKGHHYLTPVNDLSRGRVLYVAEERKQNSLDGFWGTLTREQLESASQNITAFWRSNTNSEQRPATPAPACTSGGTRQ
jgi:hypothetical protein